MTKDKNNSNKVTIFNNSETTFQVSEGKDKNGKAIIINIRPHTATALSKKEAERLLANYPKDFIEGGSVADQAKGLKEKDQRIVELEASAVVDKQALEDSKDELYCCEVAKKEALEDLDSKLEASKKATESLIKANDVAIDSLKSEIKQEREAKDMAEKEVIGLNELINADKVQHKAPTDNKAGNK